MPNLLPTPISRRAFTALLAAAAGLTTIRAHSQGATQYTFAVIGTDKRTPADPEHSDILMVSRVDVSAGTVRTLSIPRDLYVEIPGLGWNKINAAFAHAVGTRPQLDWDVGAAATASTIEHNFGLTIDGVAQTDMGVFPQIIDAIGGADVVNPYDLGEPNAATNLMYPEGPLHLDGEQAIMFCRLRHQDGDGARVMRQHLVLQAILVKLQDPAMLPRIPELIATLQDVVRTTIPVDVQAELIPMTPELSSEDLAFTNINHLLAPGYTAGGAWIYQGDWTTLPGYVEDWLAGVAG